MPDPTDPTTRVETSPIPERGELSDEERLDQLNDYAAALEQRNENLITRLAEAYTDLLRGQLDPEIRARVLERTKPLRAELKAAERAAKEAVPVPSYIEGDVYCTTIDGLREVKHLDAADVTVITETLPALPEETQRKYTERLRGALKQPTPAARMTAIAGVVFELTRRHRLATQGLEELHYDRPIEPVLVDYTNFPKKEESDFSRPPSNKVTDSPIDFDVPMRRGDKPYVYETKAYPRKKYGVDIAVRNQALKYQAAIEQGLVAGATAEVRGRVDIAFLGWAMGRAIDDPGAIPDVEIVYTVNLPSGKEYRFVLKRAESGNGLRFRNEPEKYDEEDHKVIRGIHKSLSDKSIVGIISETHIASEVSKQEFDRFFPETVEDTNALLDAFSQLAGFRRGDGQNAVSVLWRFFEMSKRPPKNEQWDDAAILQQLNKFLGYDVSERPQEALRAVWDRSLQDPGKIGSVEIFQRYEELREAQVLEKFAARIELINDKNEKSAVSEFATQAFVERSIREYQDFLVKNPKMAELKHSYILEGERIPEAVDRTMNMLERIARYERERAADPAEEERRAQRIDNGYVGLPEGVALDIEHIWLDVVYSMNSEGLEQTVVNKDCPKLLFREHPTRPSRFELKFTNIEEVEAAAEKDLELAKYLALMTASQRERLQEQLAALQHRAEFVRSYSWPERFMEAADFPAYLDGKDRRYLELCIADPVHGKDIVHQDTTDAGVAQAQKDMTRENTRRAKQYIERLKEREPERGGRMEAAAQGVVRRITKLLATIEVEKKKRIDEAAAGAKLRVADIGKRMGSLQGELKQLQKTVRQSQDVAEVHSAALRMHELYAEMDALNRERRDAFSANQRISTEYQYQIDELHVQLEAAYKNVIPERAWDSFAQRVLEVKEQNLMKLIYAATAEGDVILQEEIFRGVVTGRAAHSELAQGRNTYGAGEMVFTKEGDDWQLTEINNGSGHYRPDATSSLVYVRRLMEEKGIDVSHTKVTDCILRGRKLRDMEIF